MKLSKELLEQYKKQMENEYELEEPLKKLRWYRKEDGSQERSEDFHNSGCYPSCDGMYKYGGDYGPAPQPYEKPCWCGCHLDTEEKKE